MEGKKHFETAFRLHSDEVKALTDKGLYVYNVTQGGSIEPFVAEYFEKTVVTNFPIDEAEDTERDYSYEALIELKGSQKVESLDELIDL